MYTKSPALEFLARFSVTPRFRMVGVNKFLSTVTVYRVWPVEVRGIAPLSRARNVS